MKKRTILYIILGMFIGIGIAWAANTKWSGLTELAETPAVGDLLCIVDVSDLTMAATGTNKKVTRANLVGGLQPLDATLTDIADGTINENLVNTANPWADNEVADDISLTNITQIGTRPITSLTATNWKLFYSGGGGVPVEIALGADGTFLESNGAAAAPAFRLLLDADIPDTISLTNITQIGTRPITSLTATNWRLFYSGAGGVPIELALGANGTFLESNAVDGAPAFRALEAADIPDLSATYQPLEATLTDIADGTISENLVNTANPWAANEGGTGHGVYVIGDILYADTTTSLARLPAGTAAYILTSGGAGVAPSWATPAAAAAHELLDGSAHPDTLDEDPVAGDLIIANATPKWSRLPGGTVNQTLVMGASLPAWGTLPILGGGTGSTTASGALVNLGLNATASEINTPLDGASVTLTEFRELETIGDTTISANQWAMLGGVAETLAAAELNILDGVTGVTAAELSYIGDVTGLIQAQLDAKQGTLTNEAGLYAALSDVSLFLEDLVDDTTPQLGGPLDFNNKVLYDDWTALVSTDTSPDVSLGSFFKTANAAGTTIADFDDGDDHGDFQDGRLLFIWVNDANTTFDFTASELAWASQGSNDYVASSGDFFMFQFDSGRDGGGAGWQVIAGPMPSVVSVSELALPWGDADAALSSGGKIYFNETDEQIGIHSGDSGEISGEVALSVIQHFSITFDPDAVCDGTVDRLMLFTVGDDAPEGITIDEWKLSFSQDPATEFGEGHLMLKRADAFISVANAADMDDLATTNGASSEDTDANINGGAVVANGQVIYLQFDTAYTATGEQVIFEMWYHAEED